MGYFKDVKDKIVTILEGIQGEEEALAEVNELNVPAESYPAAYVSISGALSDEAYDNVSDALTCNCVVTVVSPMPTTTEAMDAFLDACAAVLVELRKRANITLDGVADRVRVAPVGNIEYANSDSEPMAKMVINVEVMKRELI